MFAKCILMASAFLMLLSVASSSQVPRTFTNGRIAISHDGNCYDDDDIGACAMNWGIVAAFGMQKRLVHFEHSNNLSCDIASHHADMATSATGWKHFPGFDSSVVFDCKNNTAGATAHFKAQAELSSDDNRLYLICSGPMEMPWRNINAVSQPKRKFITCISHAGWNDDFTSGSSMTHTWNSMKTSFGGDGVIFTHIFDQNGNLGGGSNWNFLSSMPDNASIPASAWTWLRSRVAIPSNPGDVSDCGMTWFLMTGSQKGSPSDLHARFVAPIPMEQTSISAPKTAVSVSNGMRAEVYRTGNVLSVHVPGVKNSGSIRLYTMLSRRVAAAQLTEGFALLPLGSLPPGAYAMTIVTNDGELSQKAFLK